MSDRKQQKQQKRRPRRPRGPRSINRRILNDQDRVSSLNVSQVTGRGDYMSVRPRVDSGPLDTILSTAAPLISKLIPAALGLLPTIFGRGDYVMGRRPKANSLVLGEGPQPMIVNLKEDPRRYIHCHVEKVQDVISSATGSAGNSAFSQQSWPMNPGQSTFEWLSQIAQAFEKYTILGMYFFFKSTSGTFNGTNQALGDVIIAPLYNSLNTSFPSLKAMQDHSDAVSGKSSQDLMCMIECRTDESVWPKFVRSSAGVANEDLRVDDLGNLIVATVGCNTTTKIGELYVAYEVEFFEPTLSGILGSDVLSDHFQLTAPSGTFPGGTSNVLVPGSTLGGTFSSGGTYTFPLTQIDGNFLFVYLASGTATALTNFTLVPSTGVALLSLWSIGSVDGANNAQAPQSTVATSTRMMCAFVVSLTGALIAPGTVGFSIGVLPAATALGDLFITEINQGIVTALQSRQSESHMQDLIADKVLAKMRKHLDS